MVYGGVTDDMIKNPSHYRDGIEENIQISLSKFFHTVDTTVANCSSDFCVHGQNCRTTGSSHSPVNT